ncbi:hypothetical protein MOO23_06530 [Rhodococcus opacus]|nr:hypothetical protein MOO23_06530 [Rhodococcus opacus]
MDTEQWCEPTTTAQRHDNPERVLDRRGQRFGREAGRQTCGGGVEEEGGKRNWLAQSPLQVRGDADRGQ